jgi:cytochrome P450
MLSRKEMTVAFETLLARLDHICIKDGAELSVSPNLLLRGYTSVPITFKKAAA